jgi:NitT/TauT family transport system substrate-binding protein
MLHMRKIAIVTAIAIGCSGIGDIQAALAQPLEKLKVAIGFIDLWDSQQVVLCKDRGEFAKAGLDVETLGTRGGSETVQAVIAGGMDIGFSVGVNSVLGALQTGTKIKIISSEFVGQNDVLVYVTGNSPIKTYKDLAGKTVGFPRPGTAVESVLVALRDREKVDFKMTSTGAMDATRVLVMTHQIDAGYILPPFGLDAAEKGEIRIIFAGDEIESMRNITNRVIVAGTGFLETRRPVAVKFLQTLDQCIDWSYANQAEALKWYAKANNVSDVAAQKGITFYSRKALAFGPLQNFDETMKLAVDGHFIDRPFTSEELKKTVDIVYGNQTKN